MDHKEIRRTFLDFFKKHGHEIVASSSLIPRDDPTLLFTNAGMVQFKSLFLGQAKRGYTRAATSQKCVRAGGKHNDLENVGYTSRHHTFFEMLGNFSFGDYFKKEAITWAWELLTEVYGLPADKLWVSVYKKDDEAYEIWEKVIGVPVERIARLGEKDNFWAMGDTGPCGPCSEVHVDQGESIGCGRLDCNLECECDRFLEIWNLVFTQFDRDIHGRLNTLPNPNIDTGMGLERIAAVVQGKHSNYDTDLFRDIISRMEDISGKKYGDNPKHDLSFRVISDHARAAAFLIGDGIMPSNEGRGYVLRRIIRRAIRYGQVLGEEGVFFHRVADKVIDIMGDVYPELQRSRSFIQGVISNEEKRFEDTLYYGMKILREEIDSLKSDNIKTIPGALAFKLYDTYGLSMDILQDVAREESLDVDTEGYEKSMKGQKDQSRVSWKGSGEEEIPEAYRNITAKGFRNLFVGYHDLFTNSRVEYIFKDGESVQNAVEGDHVEIILDKTSFYGEGGGQVGDTGIFLGEGLEIAVSDAVKYGDLIVHSCRVEKGSVSVGDILEGRVDEARRKAIASNHTTTHLLHKALREILGDHVKQAGSLVSPERLRFDFSHFAQVDQKKLREVETLVNHHIRKNLRVSTREMAMEDALKTGAMAIFEERYGEKVRLVSIEDVSKELCGGTHSDRTGDIGLFKIISESAVGANLRRIEALTGGAAIEYIQRQGQELSEAARRLKVSVDQVNDKIDKTLKDLKDKEREVESLKAKLLSRESGDLLEGMEEVDGIQILAREIEADSPRDLREYADRIRDRIRSGIIVLGSKNGDKVMLISLVTGDLLDRFKAGDIIRKLSLVVGGKGGGRPDMAQGGGNRPEKLAQALKAVPDIIRTTAG
ncbi:MAG: alanine--tRNA ligase [Deltaproteobacteria bacterium]|nr:alanine--tRNA ligase [Deltaproteobacteria bacterium]